MYIYKITAIFELEQQILRKNFPWICFHVDAIFLIKTAWNGILGLGFGFCFGLFWFFDFFRPWSLDGDPITVYSFLCIFL